MKKSKVTRYQYEIFEAGLDEYMKDLDRPDVMAALSKVKFAVLASAWSDFYAWHPDTNKKQAMSWAWEDMVMSFRGFGESSMTGPIMSLWQAIPEDKWEEARKVLNIAALNANRETPATVRRRYLTQYRCQTVRTPTWGFDLPAIVPTFGPRLRKWAEASGMNPDTVEEHMAIIEEYERMGLIDLGEKVRYYPEGEIIPENVKEPSAPLEAGLADLSAAGKKAKLTLLPGGES